MMSLEKVRPSTNANLDVLKLVDDIAAETIRNISASFYTNGEICRQTVPLRI